MRCLFAHGFEGVPNGRKARYLTALGYDVTAPLMSARGWRLSDHVAVIDAVLDAEPDLRLLVGSSFGALALAVAASARPERDLRLVLVAPAVGLHETWEAQMGADAIELWAEMGAVQYRHQGIDQEVQLPYALYTECKAASEICITHPTAIVHGLRDETIPVGSALALAARSPGVRRFVAVADGHRLLDSLDEIGAAVAVVLSGVA